jgi:hypothetical protein
LKVYYSGYFWGDHNTEHPGIEIPVRKEFVWSGVKWNIPSVYSCSKGLVIDICMEIPKEKVESYFNLQNQNKRRSDLSDEVLEQMEMANPYSMNFGIEAQVNGKGLVHPRMNAFYWYPVDEMRGQIEDIQDELMEYYTCDRSEGWCFLRACIPWRTARKPKLKTLTLTFKGWLTAYSGEHFLTEDSCGNQEVTCIHPVSKKEYRVTLHGCETNTLPDTAFRFMKDVQYPNFYKVLTYSVSPELSPEDFRIQDCERGDRPRSKSTKPGVMQGDSESAVAVIGSADGPAAIFIAGKSSKENDKRIACSSLYFTQVPVVEWRTIFYVKENEDVSLDINF